MNMHELSERQNEAKSDKGYLLTIHPLAKNVPDSTLFLFREMNKSIFFLNKENESAHKMHIWQCKQNILATALAGLANTPKDQPKKALLLGVGNCLDIPLDELAKQFDSLTLVEMDQESVENAVKKLPKKLQSKIHIIISDISGISATHDRGVINAAKTNSILEFYDNAAKVVSSVAQDVSRNVPNFGNNYSFVASHLLLSQLNYMSQRITEIIARRKFEAGLSTTAFIGTKPVADYDLFMAYQKFGRKLTNAHLELLKKSASKTGTIHLADTLVSRQFRGNLNEKPEDFPLFPIAEFETKIFSGFELVRENETWMWEHTPVIRGRGGQHFVVRSYALKPKI